MKERYQTECVLERADRLGGGRRDPFERDLARVIHSAAFRRLQSKTQVLGIDEGDFHRTRLTHSIEAAQIGTGIVSALPQGEETKDHKACSCLPSSALIACICLAHDLGHPPFGHGGEIALNCAMRGDAGGFEGNGQTLRILTELESHTEKDGKSYGLNLTRRALLGILKYPVKYSAVCCKAQAAPDLLKKMKPSELKPPKCYHDDEDGLVTGWILKPFSASDKANFQQAKEPKAPDENPHLEAKYRSLDTTILNLADDIAYGVHDLEDAIRLGLIKKEELKERVKFDSEWVKRYEELKNVHEYLFEEGWQRKQAVSALVHAFIWSARFRPEKDFEDELLKYEVELDGPAEAALGALTDLVEKCVIKTPEVQTLEYRGRYMIAKLFQALRSDPEQLIKASWKRRLEGKSNKEKKRVICDYIAGMTDEYATKVYERLFVPREGTVFQKL